MRARRVAIGLGLGLVCAGLAACGSQPYSSAATSLPRQPTVQSSISGLAPPTAVLNAARGALQSGPVVGSVEWVRTTAGKAGPLISPEPPVPADEDYPVYLVQLHGTFRLDMAPRPSGAKSPEGTVMLLYFRVQPDPTAGGDEMRLSHQTVDLRAVGAVNTFPASLLGASAPPP